MYVEIQRKQIQLERKGYVFIFFSICEHFERKFEEAEKKNE